jgi:hypothetical protein
MSVVAGKVTLGSTGGTTMTRVKRMKDRAEIELRYWAENEAELAREAKETAINRQLYVIR